ncbi:MULTISPECIES: type II toxin-antitoxin system VapC family toxin [unclassified Mesorhizobium]|uniref:type II toxin-antitoxin system VapC family toxin n=1 Tax=unclassified Mesorhizobium TaxID=325217 RepID=UPI000FCC8085|nr:MULTISPECIES: type II toxin-antitoxin system VapC family toxin [unclassified Mesorhizobium]TIT77534.1 MAG: PIN domain-containing protein [Mesorhizobium sp.]TGP24368.1 type II toxin-antitoxin system VapC family toxin [Mesorhizobium sp. M1D.F.Ca.ET.231.01.1.1]TGP35046.1 type II toxin-antitoxin system VapC family toxin [Mesorhizobium sp. M1D.F.Ca.ET.234.01.1.1]TGS49068.1 type II toxin-antitoxin system VapC family toxin [Mesorhizobium sp. M1D.F.Ca.ET.184.01.1.1]TGS63267.1 type II toxin-antitoxi
MILLDTNVVSEASRTIPDPNVVEWFRRQDLLNLYLCGPVIMEQSFGAERFLNKTGSDRHVRALDHLISKQFSGRILEFADAVPRLAGRLRATRERVGRPISLSDAMIAAICLAHDATLATRNIRDFDGLDLKLVNPFEAGA